MKIKEKIKMKLSIINRQYSADKLKTHIYYIDSKGIQIYILFTQSSYQLQSNVWPNR